MMGCLAIVTLHLNAETQCNPLYFLSITEVTYILAAIGGIHVIGSGLWRGGAVGAAMH